jgi:hypothetical protein
MNVDASFLAGEYTQATGALIKDAEGLFISFCNRILTFISDEAHALCHGLLLAVQVGCTNLVVNSDFMYVITTNRS